MAWHKQPILLNLSEAMRRTDSDETKTFLFIASAKGGGDRPPVIALARALSDRGHRVEVLCDEESSRLITSTNLPTHIFPPDLDTRGQITRWIKALGQESAEQSAELPNPMLDWAYPLVPFGHEIVKKAQA
jgi:hypothetical protein